MLAFTAKETRNVRESRGGTVQSIDRALDILEVLAREGQPMRLTDLSLRLGQHKSTVHRLLATLERRQYVEQQRDTGRYALGLRVFELGARVFNKMELRLEVNPFLKELVERTSEAAHLVIRDAWEAVYIDKIESPHSIRMFSEIGKRTPLYCTSMGKVLLAGLSDDELERYLFGVKLVRYTPNTITDTAELRRHLHQVRLNGYAIDDAEHEENVRCLGAPIRNYMGRVVGAISLAGPNMRITRERTAELAKILKEVTARISARLGFEEEEERA
ncbi:MAG: IclR family transcriptional regulator [Firmicutes bacterium]|nr:IclR family transcriptional regulator [Bacillota bacterium]